MTSHFIAPPKMVAFKELFIYIVYLIKFVKLQELSYESGDATEVYGNEKITKKNLV